MIFFFVPKQCADCDFPAMRFNGMHIQVHFISRENGKIIIGLAQLSVRGGFNKFFCFVLVLTIFLLFFGLTISLLFFSFNNFSAFFFGFNNLIMFISAKVHGVSSQKCKTRERGQSAGCKKL